MSYVPLYVHINDTFRKWDSTLTIWFTFHLNARPYVDTESSEIISSSESFAFARCSRRPSVKLLRHFQN